MNLSRLLQRALLDAIRLYQGFRVGRLSHCRFQPTCSEYAAEAISTRGVLVGSLYAVRRIARCHPLGGHGFDPVPSK